MRCNSNNCSYILIMNFPQPELVLEVTGTLKIHLDPEKETNIGQRQAIVLQKWIKSETLLIHVMLQCCVDVFQNFH